MPDELELARAVADAVLSRMTTDGGPPWVVLAVTPSMERSGPAADPTGVRHLLVTVGSAADSVPAASVYFTAGVPSTDAVVATANQLQDHAIEATSGAALPACPGHRHPLRAGVRHGLAQWFCPAEPGHHSEPILRPAA